MGWHGEQWEVCVLLDAHAGDKEREHEELWCELRARLRAVTRDPRFAEIVPEWNRDLDPETECTHRASTLKQCIRDAGHEGAHWYLDASGVYYETGESR